MIQGSSKYQAPLEIAYVEGAAEIVAPPTLLRLDSLNVRLGPCLPAPLEAMFPVSLSLTLNPLVLVHVARRSRIAIFRVQIVPVPAPVAQVPIAPPLA